MYYPLRSEVLDEAENVLACVLTQEFGRIVDQLVLERYVVNVDLSLLQKLTELGDILNPNSVTILTV